LSTDPSSPVVTSIANWEIPLYWNRIVTLLSRVVVRDEVDNSLEDVRQFLLTGSMQAWHVDWQAILVTQIQPYGANPQQPTSKVCCVVFCAGDRLDEWLQSAGERIGTWARAMGCTKLRIVGRKGWVVKLPDYKQVSITLEKQL
jgi:hypothetical protein